MVMEGVAGGDGGRVSFEDFLREVGDGIDTHTSRMREDILFLLSPYLREQLTVIRESLRAEAERREQALTDEKKEVENLLSAAREKTEKQEKLAQRLITVLDNANKRLWSQRQFHVWLSWIRRKRHQRQVGRILTHSGNMMRAYHVYTQWRLFAAARRQHKFAQVEESRWKCRETELLAQVEALKEIAEEERRRSDGLEEKMKTAFVRGVCALNKEAVHVLRGDTAGVAEELVRDVKDVRDDAGEIGDTVGGVRDALEGVEVRERERVVPSRLYDARTVRLPTTRTSRTPSSTARFESPPLQRATAATTTAPATTAPLDAGYEELQRQQYQPNYYYYSEGPHGESSHATCQSHHHIPPSGPPCHVCYAPDTCAYNQRPPTHQPFVVSVDPFAVRSYGDTPASQWPGPRARRPLRTERQRVSR